jgi:hypothetical protein
VTVVVLVVLGTGEPDVEDEVEDDDEEWLERDECR